MKLFLSYFVSPLVLVTLIHQSYSSGQINDSELDKVSTNTSIACYESCPPWGVCKENKCKCKVNEVYMKCGKHKTHLQSCACLSFHQHFIVAKCLFSCQSNVTLTVFQNSVEGFEDKVCKKFNRTGNLCGACREENCPLAFSYRLDCVHCSKGTLLCMPSSHTPRY